MEQQSTFTLQETCDTSFANMIAESPYVNPDHKPALARYFTALIEAGGTMAVEYKKKLYNGKALGRYYPVGHSKPLIYQRSMIRSLTCSAKQVDIDIKKCHATLLVNLGKKHGFATDCLDELIADFDGMVAKLKINKRQIAKYEETNKSTSGADDIAKFIYTSLLYGAGSDKINEQVGFKVNPANYAEYKKGVGIIASKVLAIPEFYEMAYDYRAEKSDEKKSDNACLSLICQELESRAVMPVIQRFISEGLRPTAYIYDGFQCHTDDRIQGLLDDINKDGPLRFIIKPWKAPLTAKMPFEPFEEKEKEEKNIIETDKEAVDIVHRLYGSRIVRAIDGWYVRMPGANFWSYGEEYVKQLIMLCDIRKGTDTKTTGYGSNNSGAKNIFAVMEYSTILFPVNEKFVNDINRNTRGRVYFTDKYFDLKKGVYVDITDDDVVPLCFIDRKAPANGNTETAMEFCRNLFGDELTIKTMLRALSRAIGGFIGDKLFYLLKGVRNSGKGMLQTLCQVAFDQYIATGDAPTIRAVSGDPAQDNRWVITTRATTKRILFTNEVKTKTENEEVKLDGTALKKVYASGGDKFLARVHRGNEMDVVNNTIAFMSLNESPSSNPADAMETCRPIVFPYKFVSSDRVSHHMSYRLANPLLKDRLQNDEELRDGFIQLVFQAFRESPVEIAEMPEESRDDYAELMGKCMTEPADILNRMFDQSADLWASTEEIMEIFAPSKKTKDFIGKFLTKSGFTKSQKSINGSRIWGFKGIMPKVQDTDEDTTDEGCKC